MNNPKHVVILGAGFAGLNAARTLARRNNHLRITVVDRRNYHLFQPLLYQVAMAGLSPAEIATPIRALLSDFPNVTTLLGEATAVDARARKVRGSFGEIDFDYLVLGTGAQHSYFGKNEWEEHAPGMKTLEQATEIRRRVLLAYEQAENELDPDKQKALLTFAVVGGGPTGVELAGALGEISRHTLGRDFRRIDPRRTRIVLIEAGPRVLAAFDEACSARALRDLEKLGVSVWTSTRVTEVNPAGVAMGTEFLRAATVIWAAGVQPSALNRTLGAPLDRQGRVIVRPDLSLPGHPNIFVTGDQTHFDEKGQPLPGLAPVAMQQGRHAARNILRIEGGCEPEPFRYVDKGQMATIGRGRAVLQFGALRLYGILAWLAWLFVHIFYLIGFKNRLFVFAQWAWAYFTHARGARLIVAKAWKMEER